MQRGISNPFTLVYDHYVKKKKKYNVLALGKYDQILA